MKKIFHRNQIIITSLAVLIAVAGYISYDKSSFGSDNAQKVSTNGALQENYEVSNETYDIYDEVLDTEQKEEIVNPGETVLTGAMGIGADFAASVKLNREQIRSKNKTTLQGIIDDTNISEELKKDAVNKIIQMTDIAEREANTEMLLRTRGFTNIVVSIFDEKCEVVLDMGEVTDAKRAQVEDIVKRETGIQAPNIVITPIENK